jgi:hypothetical protein
LPPAGPLASNSGGAPTLPPAGPLASTATPAKIATGLLLFLFVCFCFFF